jgi:hypothetical protein
MQIGDLVLLPAVRKAGSDTLIIADGFSCREQIRHGTGLWAMLPAEVLALAVQSRGRPDIPAPERRYLEPPAKADKNNGRSRRLRGRNPARGRADCLDRAKAAPLINFAPPCRPPA